ncbi:hypothetical protein ACFWBN_16895 [Streptomyces sp. NPDC059989]|uniref:hypothetical protein n=1 Tax=Streptomyces sp. NPDC059989 TaxID=3347026 RepID=UPI0036C4DA77
MANEPDTTPIHNVYAQRFAADLETNHKEQAEVSAQITELESRLKQLKADENWLSGMQGSLPPAAEEAVTSGVQVAPQPGQSPAAADAPATGVVPKPRQARKTTGRAAGRKAAQPKEAPVVASGAKAKTAAVRKTAATTPKKTADSKTKKVAEPPLRELVLALLVHAAEPRMVSEVTTELAAAHPGRPASTQVVRNTLEALAKKNHIEKEHKQGSVMYSAPRPAAVEPVAAAVPTADTTDEKEPAEV